MTLERFCNKDPKDVYFCVLALNLLLLILEHIFFLTSIHLNFPYNKDEVLGITDKPSIEFDDIVKAQRSVRYQTFLSITSIIFLTLIAYLVYYFIKHEKIKVIKWLLFFKIVATIISLMFIGLVLIRRDHIITQYIQRLPLPMGIKLAKLIFGLAALILQATLLMYIYENIKDRRRQIRLRYHAEEYA